MTIPKEWQITSDFDSHRPLLYTAIMKSKPKFIIECGSGEGSTKLIDSVCDDFLSYETNEEWFDKMFPQIKGAMICLSDWKNMAHQTCDLLFVDCAPAESRKGIIEKHKDTAKVIVTHDTEPGAEWCYGMSPVLNTFKYRIDYKPEGLPWATAVSNTIDVSKWKL
jgi:hypothetical protein